MKVTIEQLKKNCHPSLLDEFEIIHLEGSKMGAVLLKSRHGLVKTRFYDLTDQKRIPDLRSALDKTSYWSSMASNIHKDYYDYSKVNYISSHKKVKVICPDHGVFEITPNNHLNGRGCKKCTTGKSSWKEDSWRNAAQTSKSFQSYKLYIISCTNDNERFIKVGKTFVQVKVRFWGKNRMPYKYRIEEEIEGTAKEISNLEKQIIRSNKDHRYVPLISFGGKTECFSSIYFNGKHYA